MKCQHCERMAVTGQTECEHCIAELRAMDDAANEPAPWFINYYACPRCDYQWQDEWDCMCNDECGECGCNDIEPYDSEEIAPPLTA